MEDQPTMNKLNLTMVKLSETENALSRSILPEYVISEHNIEDCKLDELKEIALERGLSVYEDKGFHHALLVIQTEKYKLNLWAKI